MVNCNKESGSKILNEYSLSHSKLSWKVNVYSPTYKLDIANVFSVKPDGPDQEKVS